MRKRWQALERGKGVLTCVSAILWRELRLNALQICVTFFSGLNSTNSVQVLPVLMMGNVVSGLIHLPLVSNFPRALFFFKSEKIHIRKYSTLEKNAYKLNADPLFTELVNPRLPCKAALGVFEENRSYAV